MQLIPTLTIYIVGNLSHLLIINIPSILPMVNIVFYKPLNHFKSSSILYIVKEMMLTIYNIDYKDLGKRIRAERRKQDLTQEKLAEMANISDSFMGHIERGGRTLSIETLAKLANALNLSIEYIVCGEFNYQPDMLPEEILDALNRMSGNQRKVFLKMMKTLAAHQDMWPV